MNNISEKLTQKNLLDILLAFYIKGQKNENVNVVDLVEEIKQQVLQTINNKE